MCSKTCKKSMGMTLCCECHRNRQEEYGDEGADPPGHDTGPLCQAPFQDLIPPNQLLALGCQEAVDAADEPALQLVLIL